MGHHQQSSLYSRRMSEAEDQPERGQDDSTLGLRGPTYENRGSRDPKYQGLNDGDLGLEDQEEETSPEEVTGEEFVDAQNPEEALTELERALEKDAEEGVPEMSRLSTSQRTPGTSVGWERRKKRRLFELAKPKTNWQVLKDRMGCCCRGYAWITPCMRNLQFCPLPTSPSVYWTERFLEDTTLTITVPEVSCRLEELARPKKFYSEYYNNNRTSPTWPIPRSTLEYRASSRLRELATPKVRNNIWSIHMSEVSQVSKAARMATPSLRIIQLAKPRAPAALLEEWDPMPKPKPHVSDYNRLLHLAMPKAQSDKCVPDRDPRWEVLEVTKKAVASPCIVSLAKPKVRRDLSEGYNLHPLACTSLPPPRVSPKKHEQPRPGPSARSQ
ncbi:sperm microtubule associated protein 2 [Mesoplodon densirostris]|uniref:sperm microtubule associated protein 2 n=1 Tax=Mesoplodon densirostris TaxID=48708 RepID=UPI0028DCF129|nr:sperm microtubule associated protein 2 [Mesoplodon densirostris]